MSEYTVDHFIAKFEAIPEEMWCVGNYQFGDAKCAMGHCGGRVGKFVEEEEALIDLLLPLGGPADINDGRESRYPQRTPKQRILAALHDIKAKQEAAV